MKQAKFSSLIFVPYLLWSLQMVHLTNSRTYYCNYITVAINHQKENKLVPNDHPLVWLRFRNTNCPSVVACVPISSVQALKSPKRWYQKENSQITIKTISYFLLIFPNKQEQTQGTNSLINLESKIHQEWWKLCSKHKLKCHEKGAGTYYMTAQSQHIFMVEVGMGLLWNCS